MSVFPHGHFKEIGAASRMCSLDCMVFFSFSCICICQNLPPKYSHMDSGLCETFDFVLVLNMYILASLSEKNTLNEKECISSLFPLPLLLCQTLFHCGLSILAMTSPHGLEVVSPMTFIVYSS